jgi:hypothetical protein
VTDETTKLLYSTTDAQVWAQEWCRIAREIEADPERGPVIDEGWMIGWFANAMCVAEDRVAKQLRDAMLAALHAGVARRE